MSDLRARISSASLAQGTTALLGKASNVVLGIVLARLLFPEDYGLFAVTLIVTSLANMLSNFGFQSYIIQVRELNSATINTCYTLNVVLSIALGAVVALIGLLWPDPPLFLPQMMLLYGLHVFISGLSYIELALLKRDLDAVRTDQEGARSWMAGVCGPHELKVHSSRALGFRHSGTVLKSMATTLGYVEYGVDVSVRVHNSDPLNCFSVSLPVVGEQELTLEGGRIRSDRDMGTILLPSAPQELVIAGNCRKILVAITTPAIAGVLGDLLQRKLDKPVVFQPGIDAANGDTASWWRMVRGIRRNAWFQQTHRGQNVIFIDGRFFVIPSLNRGKRQVPRHRKPGT